MGETDLISRQAAIKILRESEEYDADIPNRADGVRDAIIDIMSLPTIEERKKGKWIKDEEKSADHVEPIFICSSCHNYEAWGLTECTRYCPNCGARMEEK